jgi:hypothetical protein
MASGATNHEQVKKKRCNAKALKLRDENFGNQWVEKVLDRWNYDDLKNDPKWRKDWISFDCALYNAEDDRIYLGITSFDADIFKAYDRKLGQFVDLGYRQIADSFDGKFHRSLVKGSDGCLYAAVALLHDVDKYHDAPGSPIVKFDPRSGALTRIGTPLPHVYIQSLIIDRQANMLYGLCFAPEFLVSFNLRSGEAKNLGLIGTGIGGMAQGENIVQDDAGCVWSNWSLTRAWQDSPGVDAVRLCKYDPKQQRIIFFPHGLPFPDGRQGTVKPESYFNFHDGYMYASGFNGSLYRIDPETGRAAYLFTPTPDRPSRLSSLVVAGEGVAYGITGRKGQCELMRVNYRQGTFDRLGEVRDSDGTALWQCHDIVTSDDGRLYLCENDHPHRSSYLWEVTLD